MRLLLYANTEIAKFFLDAGWYKGSEFAILVVEFFRLYDGGMTILSIQVAKFMISFGVFLRKED